MFNFSDCNIPPLIFYPRIVFHSAVHVSYPTRSPLDLTNYEYNNKRGCRTTCVSNLFAHPTPPSTWAAGKMDGTGLSPSSAKRERPISAPSAHHPPYSNACSSFRRNFGVAISLGALRSSRCVRRHARMATSSGNCEARVSLNAFGRLSIFVFGVREHYKLFADLHPAITLAYFTLRRTSESPNRVRELRWGDREDDVRLPGSWMHVLETERTRQ